MQPGNLTVYVPSAPVLSLGRTYLLGGTLGLDVETRVRAGTAIVGMPIREWFERDGEDPEDAAADRVVLDYQAPPRDLPRGTFADRAALAADRHLAHATTDRRTVALAAEVTPVGDVDPASGNIKTRSDAAERLLALWLGLPLDPWPNGHTAAALAAELTATPVLTGPLGSTEAALVEFAAVIRDAVEQHHAPAWAASLVAGGLRPDRLRGMAAAWESWSIGPPDIADRALALAHSVEQLNLAEQATQPLDGPWTAEETAPRGAPDCEGPPRA